MRGPAIQGAVAVAVVLGTVFIGVALLAFVLALGQLWEDREKLTLWEGITGLGSDFLGQLGNLVKGLPFLAAFA